MHSALALALLACCRQVDGAAEALAGPEGSPVLCALLSSRQLDHQDHELGLLLSHLCFACGLLPQLWDSCGTEEGVGPGTVEPTVAQAQLLLELCNEAEREELT